MSKFIQCLLVINLSFFTFSCSTHINEYESVKKPFDIKEYFSGTIIAWGIIQDYSNKVNKRFCVEVVGTWEGDKGTLAETFYFDGEDELSYRNWQLNKLDNGNYTGIAEDVLGEAQGVHKGFAFHFQYNLLLTLGEATYEVSMDDWMYQLDDYKVINKTSMHKFGVKVADITLFFDKKKPSENCAERAKVRA